MCATLKAAFEGKDLAITTADSGEAALAALSADKFDVVISDIKMPGLSGLEVLDRIKADSSETEVLLMTAYADTQTAVDAMKKEGREYAGILYAGLMITENGPKVIEFNCRFGDPETQPLLMRLESDLVPILQSCMNKTLADQEIKWSEKAACCVVMASGGYPGSYEKGMEISGLEEANALKETVVFHAGTKLDGETVLTNGGRVLGITSLGNSIKESIENAYKAVEKISFEKAYFRKDIGQKALNRKK